MVIIFLVENKSGSYVKKKMWDLCFILIQCMKLMAMTIELANAKRKGPSQTIFVVSRTHQSKKCPIQKNKKIIRRRKRIINNFILCNLVHIVIYISSKSIFICINPFREAAEEKEMEEKEELKKSKVIKIDSQKSWEHHIYHATNKKYPVSLFCLC